MRRRRQRAGDRGAASVLAVGILSALFALLIALVPLYAALIERQRVAGAADAAALAAADVAVGREPGLPCTVARFVAEANTTTLDACVVDGYVVTVRVVSDRRAIRIEAVSTAGPPAPD
ncbi:MAG TPA: flp pilus-assembly TadE/G-like family protein [Terrimesophilobacter sp.]|nr:flp pilus-assembly TadE/G-like family protein [Terrimesophilobacter sp.]